MPTRTISLTDHGERLIEEAVASGEDQNASAVVRAGLRLLERPPVARGEAAALLVRPDDAQTL